MVESRLASLTFFLLLALVTETRGDILGSTSRPSDFQLFHDNADKEEGMKQNPIYAQRAINIHQPVYQPGYGNFHIVKPMFLTPPPPAIEENLILEPAPIYSGKEVRIQTRTKVKSYPMQFQNPFNYYHFPRVYNPFMGKDSPANNFHPFNMLYGPQQYFPVNTYGLTNHQNGMFPTVFHNDQKYRAYSAADFIPDPINPETLTDVNENTRSKRRMLKPKNKLKMLASAQKSLKNSMASIVEAAKKERKTTRGGLIDVFDFGFNSMNGVNFDPYSTQFGPFGPYSPYAGSMERQLRQASPPYNSMRI